MSYQQSISISNQQMSEEQTIYKKRNQTQMIPTCTFASLFITIFVGIGSIAVLLSGKYVETQNDGYRVYDQKQFYRLFTCMFSVMSFVELGIMIACFIWLPFILNKFEKRFGTVYTLYHFFRTHIMIQFLVGGIYQLLFLITTMKNFNQTGAGILPYCLYMHLKLALQNPNDTGDYWFLPLPMKRWISSLVISIILLFWSPESQGVLIVLVMYLFNLLGISFLYCCKCRQRVTSKQGPLCDFPFNIIEKLIPECLKNSPDFYLLTSNKETQQI